MQKSKTKKVTLKKLARMVANGFENTATKAEFVELKGDIKVLQADVSELKADASELKADISDVKLRLDNLAPKFEF